MEITTSKLEPNLRKVISIRNYHGNDIEQKAQELYQCLSNISKCDEKYVYIYLRIIYPSMKDENYAVKLPNNFKIILLSSLRHLKVYNQSQKFPMRSLILLITKDVLCSLDYLDFRTLYLFKVLDQIVVKKLDLINDIHKVLLSTLYEICYASPIAILRNSAVSLIHKIELKLGNGLRAFNPLLNVGILTSYDDIRIKLEQIKTDIIHTNLQQYMKFILKYFHFNVYNKGAGILYKAIISRYDISDFKIHIWPLWSGSFEKYENSREFQQSFLKYWIPFSVQEYKIDLYIFLRDQRIPKKLLVEILLELRRKRHVPIEYLSEGLFHTDFMKFIEDINTSDKAFDILCTFPFFNEIIPVKYLEIFEEHFLGCKVHSHNSEKYAHQFLCHIFVSEHVNIQKSGTSSIYNNFLKKLEDFIIDNLEEEKNQILSLKLCKILVGMKRSSKDLKLKYDLPKRYQYGPDENKYFSYLEENGILNIFTKHKELISRKLVKLFNTNITCDDMMIWLLQNTFDSYEINDLIPYEEKKGENYISLSNLEKYTDFQRLSLYKKAKKMEKDELVSSFQMMEHRLVKVLSSMKICEGFIDEIFEVLKMLNSLYVATQISIVKEPQSSTIMNMLNFMVTVVEEDMHEGLSTKTRKVLEHVFSKIIDFLNLSPATLSEYGSVILEKLIILIERSNMKRVVSDALNLVPTITRKMAISSPQSQKSLDLFFKNLLNIIVSPENFDHLQKSRMRKHPRLRSLLHAVCKGAATRQREFVDESGKKLIQKSSQHNLEPTVQVVLLECLEILIVEPNFHNYTFVYLEDSIKLGLNSFGSESWSVKNAAIQLTNTIITRIFGVQQTDNIRLRSFQEFCILFPRLSDLFYNILSSSSLDDRAIIVLQYFSASEVLVYEHGNEEVRKNIEKFLCLLKSLLRSRENYIIKFIPHAIVNLCVEESYPYHMEKVFDYVVSNLNKKPSNVIVNHLVLFKEFVRKLNENYSYVKPLVVDIESSIVDVVNKMNNFLKNKDLQYLDLHNIRHFVLDQCTRSCNDNISLNVSWNRWNLYNFIVNFPLICISTNFQELFEIMYISNSEFNFLMEIFLDKTIIYVLDNRDFCLISKIFNTLATKILRSRDEKDKTLERVLTESILKLVNFLEYITLDDGLCDNIRNINFYQAVLIHIILSKQNVENRAALCDEAFKKISHLQDLDNFQLGLIPDVLIFVHENIDVLNRYAFLKFVLCLVVTDCEKENIYDFLTKLCRKSVDCDNYVANLLTYEFLNDFFEDHQVVRKFLTDALKLIEQFEKKIKFDTFYTDTYQSLHMQKNVINKIIS